MLLTTASNFNIEWYVDKPMGRAEVLVTRTALNFVHAFVF